MGIFSVFLVLCCAFGSTNADQGNTQLGSISGQISNPEDGSVWPGIEVHLKDNNGRIIGSSVTDFEGRYQLWASNGNYQISVEGADSTDFLTVNLLSDHSEDKFDFAPRLNKKIKRKMGANWRNKHSWFLLPIGVFLAFTILHFSIFLFELKDPANLIYSIFTLMCSMGMLWHFTSPDFVPYIERGSLSISIYCFLILVLLFYPDSFLEQEEISFVSRKRITEKKGKYSKLGIFLLISLSLIFLYLIIHFEWNFFNICLFFTAGMIIVNIVDKIAFLKKIEKETLSSIAFAGLLFCLFLIGKLGCVNWSNFIILLLLIGILLHAIFVKKADGSWIIGIGSIGFSLAILLQVLSSQNVVSLDFIYVFGLLSFVISMSIFLARRYANTNADNARKTEELEQARQLQLSMLPSDKPSTPLLDISWYMETATEVGGDYYDYSVGEDGVVSVILGDATGHGMQAGTVVTATKSLFQSHADHPVITETFSAMSRSLKGMNFPRLGMAMTMVKVQESKLQISAAGIPPALLYRAASKEIEEIEIGGMPLGYSTSFQYQQEEYYLHAGDTLVLMSDGLPERLNSDDEELGYPKTQELFRQCADMAPDAICAHLAAGGDEWAKGRVQDDDVTFVVLKMK
jgi:hypothetical protein